MSRELPIYDVEDAIVSRVRSDRRLIIQAPTGSGKSTQVPQMLLDHGLLGDGPAGGASRGEAGKQVMILQPRRLATRLLASRVAQERNVRLGDEVGYQIRFEDVSSPRTRIKYVTEGILLRRMLSDPTLGGISALVFDEFHERHLYGDITLARALDLQETVRPDLKILVMSATLDSAQLERYLAPCKLVLSEGRMFPVAVEYLDDQDYARAIRDETPPWELAALEFERLQKEIAEGDFLIFMPGAYEIQRTMDAIRNTAGAHDFMVLPLHGELPPKDQDAAVARYDKRKVIVSTNVAETSVTIDGIRVVLDAGLARIPRYDPYRGINTLLIEKISRASADQRAGRAGRTAPGRCVRLWSEQDHRGRPGQEVPEIRRLDLAEVVLTLKASGVTDVRGFRWLEPPDARSLERSETLLKDLGAIDAATGAVTELGRRMLSFPVHPRYARMLLAGAEYDCVYQMALIAALTQGRDLLLRRQGKSVSEGRDDLLGGDTTSDFFVLMRAWQYADRSNFSFDACRRLGIHVQAARQVRPLVDAFLRIAKDEGLPINTRPPDDEAVQKSILIGFSDHVARRLDSGTLRCELVHGRRGVLARESAVQKSPLLVAAEVREIEGRDVNVILSLATAIKESWLRELFPADMAQDVDVELDPTTRRVIAYRRTRFRDLVLERKATQDDVPEDAAAALLAEEVLAGRVTLKEWDEAVDQWITRVNCLARWCADLQLPPVTPDGRSLMVQQVCVGAFSVKEAKDRPVWPTVKSWLTGAQQALVEKHAPERIELPNGRKARITYSEENPPYVAARIQDLYGMKESPRIAMGRIPLVVHILAPSQRPVQITQDLAGFWRDHYPRVKQELQRKYPKHEWR
jgi:ATP-dependent helicase HrpB